MQSSLFFGAGGEDSATTNKDCCIEIIHTECQHIKSLNGCCRKYADCVIQSKVPEQLLNGDTVCSGVVLRETLP